MPHLPSQPVHLGREGRMSVEPPFTGMEWYDAYVARHADDGVEGRLVSQYSFEESWTSWEMHPAGPELVICTAGSLTLIQELPDGGVTRATLGPGDYAIIPAGVWHTADVGQAATVIFATAGEGTQHRPR